MRRDSEPFEAVREIGYALGALCRAVVEMVSLPRAIVRSLRRNTNPGGTTVGNLLLEIGSEDPEAQESALQAIVQLGPDRACRLLADGLVDPDPHVRAATAAAVARLGAVNLVFELILTLEDQEIEVRRTAKQAVEILSGEVLALDVELSGPALEREVDALKRWWEERRCRDLRSNTEEGV